MRSVSLQIPVQISIEIQCIMRKPMPRYQGPTSSKRIQISSTRNAFGPISRRHERTWQASDPQREADGSLRTGKSSRLQNARYVLTERLL